MTKWGYKPLAKNRAINMNKNDFSISEAILTDVPELVSCIACGQCTSTCTAGALTDFNFRKLHTLVRRGEYKGAKAEAEKCMLCGKCIIVCPRGINTRRVVVSIRRHTEI